MKYLRVFFAFGLLAVGSTTVFATALPITDSGILQLQNLTGELVGVTSVPPCINWGGAATCTAGTSQEMGVSGSSNLFSTATSVTDQIMDLSGLGPLTNFETVAGAGALAGQTVDFNLVTLVLPNGGAGFGNCASNAANNSCNPAGSPFTFSEDSTGTQLTISLTTTMNAYTGTFASGDTPYRGIFTTQQSGTLIGLGACSGATADITAVLACEGAGGTIQATWSATESPIPGVPEPGTSGMMLLAGGGLILLSRLRRPRKY